MFGPTKRIPDNSSTKRMNDRSNSPPKVRLGGASPNTSMKNSQIPELASMKRGMSTKYSSVDDEDDDDDVMDEDAGILEISKVKPLPPILRETKMTSTISTNPVKPQNDIVFALPEGLDGGSFNLEMEEDDEYS